MSILPRKPPASMPESTDVFQTFRRRWYCTPPSSRWDIRWRATSYEWSEDNTIQDIYAWEPVTEEKTA